MSEQPMINFEIHQARGGNSGASEDFEEMLGLLVRTMREEAHLVFANHGDWGIDVVVGNLHGQVTVWQAKYFVRGVSRVQQRQITASFDSALRAAAKHQYTLGRWILAVPASMDGPALQWWQEWKEEQNRATGVTIELWDETKLRELLLRPDAVNIRLHYYNPYRYDGQTSRNGMAVRQDRSQPVEQWTARQLGVHPAIHGTSVADASVGFLVPEYLERHHDKQLRNHLISTTRIGQTTLVLIRGSSCTGKTRAAFEAIRDCLLDWRLVFPKNSEELLALLDAGPPAPRTVLWLNETQNYLDGTNGEQAAARLHNLLEGPGPVVILCTLWPEYHRVFTATPQPDQGKKDAHPNARALLGQAVLIPVPDSFTEESLRNPLVNRDLSLAAAVSTSSDGKITQTLAAGPELVDHYEQPSKPQGPLGYAIITAAIDARRLGYTSSLPAAFLKAAAPGYLTNEQRAAADRDAWFDQAVQYAEQEVKGVCRALEPVPRPNGIGRLPHVYSLNDYLDQYGRRIRHRKIPPPDFWTAAAGLNAAGGLVALAGAAESRGLLRDAARLYKRAAQRDTKEALALFRRLRSIPLGDRATLGGWVSPHADLHDPHDLAELLNHLHGVPGAISDVLERDPAAHTAADQRGVTDLLDALWRIGAAEQIGVLAARAAAHASLDDPTSAILLLNALWKVGAAEQAAVLAERAAAGLSLDAPGGVAELLDVLWKEGAAEQAIALAARVAAHAPLKDSFSVVRLLATLRKVGAADQAAVLADRAAAHVPLGNPATVAALLFHLRREQWVGQAATLLMRDPATYAALKDLRSVVQLLEALRKVGAADQAAVLADRAATHAPLGNPDTVTPLLYDLRAAGKDEQIAALIARGPAVHAALEQPYKIAHLLEALWEVGAAEQAAVLAERAVAHVPFDPHDRGALPRLLEALWKVGAAGRVPVLVGRVALNKPDEVALLLKALWEVGAAEHATRLAERAATYAPLEDPSVVVKLLEVLWEMGAAKQAAVLAERAVNGVPLVAPGELARLLKVLWEMGAAEQAAVLAERAVNGVPLVAPGELARLLEVLWEMGAADHIACLSHRDPAGSVVIDEPDEVARLLKALGEAGPAEQAIRLANRAAADSPILGLHSAADLLNVMRKAGAEQQAKTFVDRLPAEGLFELLCKQAEEGSRYAFGRELDGRPTPSWCWHDLD